MFRFIISVGVFNFAVAFFLLLAASVLAQQPAKGLSLVVAALVSGAHSSICLLPEFACLSGFGFRLAVLLLAAVIAFGGNKRGIYRGILYLLLELTLTGFTSGLDHGVAGFLIALSAVGALCLLLSRRRRQTMPVELCYQGRQIRLTALCDTGNTLKDPVTGQSVTVIGPEAAEKLTGLTRKQLKDPIKTMAQANLPGLRLVPFHTISHPAGFLLALRIQEGKIDGCKGSLIVAFAPEQIDKEGTIQALTGGFV